MKQPEAARQSGRRQLRGGKAGSRLKQPEAARQSGRRLLRGAKPEAV
ncbi:MAG: hypothetical protein LBD24_03520 [Spirochaetaceae bacterium]|nr:hypothetical protein [Spirochaetaceae bacterium]